MLEWLWAANAGLIILLGATAGMVALFVSEDQRDRRKTAFSIVKLTAGTSTCLTALTTAAIRLTDAGLF